MHKHFAILRWNTPRLNFANMTRKEGRWFCAAIYPEALAIDHASRCFSSADCLIVHDNSIRINDHLNPDDPRLVDALLVPATRPDEILEHEASMLRQRLNAGKLPLVQHRRAENHLAAIEAASVQMLEAAE